MSGLKELKRRQKTAMVIERMTGAMKMISRARYTAAQNEMRKKGDLVCVLQNLAERIVKQITLDNKTADVAFALEGPVKAPWLLVVITSDSGLCAGFNQKIIKSALQWLEQHKNESVQVLCLGKKGLSALQKKPGIVMYPGFDSAGGSGAVVEKPSIHHGLSQITEVFKNRKIRGCCIVYGKFFNILKQEPEIVQILPSLLLESQKAGAEMPLKTALGTAGDHGVDASVHSKQHHSLVIEPNADKVLDAILEIWIQTLLKNIADEHKLSEHAARMNAMDSANSNAKDMIRRLKIKYNRLRQDRITKEIIEIISGSNLGV